MFFLQMLFIIYQVEFSSSTYTRSQCISYLQQEDLIPKFNISSSDSLSISSTASQQTMSVSSSVAPTASINDSCITQLFPNWNRIGVLPWYLLTEYGITTTLPPTTTISTPSYQEVREKLCRELTNYTFSLPTCVSPCDPCVGTILNNTNEYLICQNVLSDTDIANVLHNEPMVLTLLMNAFGVKLNKYKGECPNPPTYRDYTNFLWYSGKRYRYNDLRLPDYYVQQFEKNNRWHKRNDTIEIPYGNLPRGEYSFEFVMYEKNISNEIIQEKVRLKDEWPYKHPIITGAFIDPRVETGLVNIGNLVLNSVVISCEVSPARSNPLPGENIISLTHLDKSLINPVCIYWQALDPGQGKLPSQGYWSNYGCRVFKTNESMTVCRCTHLSSFALLMGPAPPPIEEKIDPLDALNILLTLISVMILIIYLLAMIMLKCYQNAYSRIYMLLAFSCLMAQLVFLIGFVYRNEWGTCTIISTWLQFFHVCVMSWVMIESVHQLSRITLFFNDNTNIDAFYVILGFGFPVAVLVALQEFPYKDYDRLKFCWAYIEGGDLLFFAGPLVVLCIVTVSLRLITFIAIRKKPEKIKNDINYIRAYRSILASCVILPTFILLWIFGIYAVRQDGVVADIAMIAIPVLNVLIGGEILYLYFYQNDEVRENIMEEMRIREKQKLMTYSHLRGLDMKVKYQAKKIELDKDKDDTQWRI